MKNQWNQFKLREILTLQYGEGLPKNKRIPGEYPVYGSGGIVGYYNEPLIKGPGIIVGRKGSIGSVFYEKKDFYPIDTVFYVELKSTDCDLRYVYYLLLQSNLKNLNTDAAVPGLNRQVAHMQIVKIPELLVQRKISSILSAYDDLIENNTRRIQILEEMAQLIYQEWFVNFRFPGHEKAKFVDSEMGKIPEGWEVKRLSDIVETQYGYTESASEEIIGPKFLRGKDINKNSYINWDEVPYCKIEAEDYEKYKLNRGDIVIIRMADPGKVGIVEKDIDAIFASYLIRLKIKNGIDPYYLFYFLLSEQYQSYIVGASTGTTRKSASAGVITDTNILLPSKIILEQFVEVIRPLRQLLNTLLEKNVNLRQTRDLLLPKLISGELDVSNMDIPIRKTNEEK